MTTTTYSKKLENLINAIKVSDNEWAFDDIDSVQNELDSFAKYVYAVYRMETLMRTVCVRYEGAERRVRIKNADENRRHKHDAAVTSAHVINKMCDLYGVEHLCPDTDDRYVIADFAAAITLHFYCTGQYDRAVDMDGIVAALESGCIKISERKEVIEEA